MSKFIVDIYTPTKVLARDIVAESLKIPTVSGQINVLKDHTHIVTKLDTGVLEIEENGKVHYFSLTSGICKVLKDKITILTPAGEKAEDIDQERAKKAHDLAFGKLNSTESLTDAENEKYQRKLLRAKLRIMLAKNFTKKH